MRRLKKVVLLSILFALLVYIGCSTQPKPAPKQAEPVVTRTSAGEADVQETASDAAPKRIIFMIGDGMGVAALTATMYAKGAPLTMLEMDEMGLTTTHSYDFSTTDSAASAAALATGQKTHFEAVSVQPGTPEEAEEEPENHLETILEKAHNVGWKTGLVATVRINHATPGAFAGHRNERHSYEGIALDMSKSGVDVLIGGGRKYFDQREDELDLLAGFEEAGYAVARGDDEVLEMSASAERLIAISEQTDLPPADDPERHLTLGQMTTAAIDVLDRENDEGFFLMVEGSQIDWRAHAMDGLGVVTETLEFDQAIRTALEYAAGRDDTLVVVTADHETGGMTVLDSAQADRVLEHLGGHKEANEQAKRSDEAEKNFPSAELLPTIEIGEYSEEDEAANDDLGLGALAEAPESQIRPDFGYISVASRAICPSTGRFGAIHTSEMVPVFAQGAAAKWVAESRDNAVLGARLIALVGADSIPETSDEPARAQEKIDERAGDEPKNIILMVGDGMGVPALTAAYYAHGPLQMHSMPVQGLVATHAVDRLATDNAAAATALATGQRTRRGALGVVPQGDELEPAQTILERAEAGGKKTGIVSSSPLVHPVNAAFFAHLPDASDAEAINAALVDLSARVKGSDGVELILADDSPGSAPASVADRTQRALAELSRGANDEEPAGFFLLVNAAKIAQAQSSLARDQALVDEMIDFDQAVGAALDFARREGDTLVLVTGTHDYTTATIDQHYGHDDCKRAVLKEFEGDFELVDIPVEPASLGPACQSLSTENLPVIEMDEPNRGAAEPSDGECFGDEALRARLQEGFAPLQLSTQHAWSVHAAQNAGAQLNDPTTANFVPIFAFGPGARHFVGFQDQPQVGRALGSFIAAP